MNRALYQLMVIIVTFFFSINIYTRSLYRPFPSKIPSIAIYDSNNKLRFTLQSSYLESYPHFTFTPEKFKKYNVPPVISYRTDKSRFLTKKKIDRMINIVIKELSEGKKHFSQFTTLKAKNFNFNRCCGLIVLKCKHHPFIVKLFIEKPETYFDPYCKGIESIAFFFMGGANRHITGMSRLLNLETIQKKLERLDQWKNSVQFPRKWFWLPQKPLFMKFYGKNFGKKSTLTNKIPEIFAIIADEMSCKEDPSITQTEKIETIMNLCNDLDTYLDAHYDNFIFKKNNDGTYTITIIDTEHIPTMTGLKKRQIFKNYWQWYAHLTTHCIKKMFFRTKNKRLMDQYTPNELALT